MNIIIVGCGNVGYTLAKDLAAGSGVNVTIIDTKPGALEKAGETIDAMLVRGDGLNANTLLEAGTKDADFIIAVTDTDEKNILCCVSAKHIGAKYSIARVRTPEYAFDTQPFWKSMGLDMMVNPAQETAREISRLLRFPVVDDIDVFMGGRMELVAFTVSEAHDFFAGKSVAQIFHKKHLRVLLALVERGDTVFIPGGGFIFEKGDTIRVMGRPSDIMRFFAWIGKDTERVRHVLIVGGGRTAHYLIELLLRHASGTPIKVIEVDREKCEALSERFPQCLIIHGDGADEDTLTAQTDHKAGAMVCLADRDEENVIMALYALRLGVRKVVTKINEINAKMVKNLGLGSIISPKNTTSEQLLRYIKRLMNASGGVMMIQKLFENGDDVALAVELHVGGASRCTEKPLKDVKIKRDILFGCIVRDSDIIIPTGDSVIKTGDTVIVIAKNVEINELDDILAG